MTIDTMACPIISTAHITEAAARYLTATKDFMYSNWSGYGWIFVVNEDEEDDAAIKHQCIRDIFNWARTAGYSYVRVDQDAGPISALPQYDW